MVNYKVTMIDKQVYYTKAVNILELVNKMTLDQLLDVVEIKAVLRVRKPKAAAVE